MKQPKKGGKRNEKWTEKEQNKKLCTHKQQTEHLDKDLAQEAKNEAKMKYKAITKRYNVELRKFTEKIITKI